jgi:hypothetical protein
MQAQATSFFLQMAVILFACRVVGLLARRIGQPQVVGEMIAGVLLGPSLLGMIWPDSTRLIFTAGIARYPLCREPSWEWDSTCFSWDWSSTPATSGREPAARLACRWLAWWCPSSWVPCWCSGCNTCRASFRQKSATSKVPCSSARRSPSPPSRCSLGSSRNAGFRTPARHAGTGRRSHRRRRRLVRAGRGACHLRSLAPD